MSVTLLVPYSASGQENGGVKMDVPAQSADPGEPVRMYLWGRSREALAGYGLTQGAQRLGAGRLARYDGQTEMAVFDLDGSGALQAFTWPVLSLAAVAAVGRLYHVTGNAVSLIALPGEDVTRYFRLSGNALAAAEAMPKLIGTVAATVARSPWCREWEWIAPQKPASGLPEGMCTDDEEDRDGAAYWFFLMRYGVLVEEFSLTLSEPEISAFTPVLHLDANDITANDGSLVNTWKDKNGIAFNFLEIDDVNNANNGVPIGNGFDNGQIACSVKYHTALYRRPCVRIRSYIKRTANYDYFNFSSILASESVRTQNTNGKSIFIVCSPKDPMPGVLHSNQYRSGGSAAIWIGSSGGVGDSMQGQLGDGPTYDNGTLHDSYMIFMDGEGTDVFTGGQALFPGPSLTTCVLDTDQKQCRVFKNGFHAFNMDKDNAWTTNGDVMFDIGVVNIRCDVKFVKRYTPVNTEYESFLDVFEIRVYDCVFTDSERASIENELLKKWSIV